MSGASASTSAPWTDQQRAAIELRSASVGLSAGAGCGKTFVLTQRFLSHLEPAAPPPGPARVSQLVAITFTERAAREMRDRIRSACQQRLATCADSEVADWQKIVDDLDQARISTIHAFCSGLLRAHAVEAAVDPRFQLLSETLSAGFLETAIADAVRSLLAGGDADVEELVYRLGSLARLGETLRPLLGRLHRLDIDGWLGRDPDEVIEGWRRAWLEVELPRSLADFARSPDGIGLRELLGEICSASTKDKAAVAQALLETVTGWGRGEVSPAALEALYDQFKVDALLPRTKLPEIDALRQRAKSVLEVTRKLVRKLTEAGEVNPADLYDAIALGRQLLAVCRRVTDQVEARKLAEGVLDFDDLIVRARNLLRDHEEIRRRVAGGIRLLMVDEFQDTDPVQAELVRYLCGDDESLRLGKLFLVGDAKQSIYRFRNAEPGVFAELRRELPPPGRLPLSRNFRSQPAILQFVNALFDGALSEEYEPLDAAAAQLSTHPCIEFLFPQPPAEDAVDSGEAGATESTGESAADDSAPEDETESIRLRRLEAASVAARISQLIRGGQAVVREKPKSGEVSLRPARPRDIVILLRALTDVRLLEEALRDLGIDYYVVGGQAFYAQQEIYDVVNLCRAVDEPADDVALLGVLRSPFFSLSDDTIYLLAERGQGLWQGLATVPEGLSEEQAARVRRARALLAELRVEKDRRSRADWMGLAFALTGYDAALLAEFLGPRKLANLEKLISLAEEIDSAGALSLAAFTARLQTAVFSEAKEALAPTHPESADVVRIMSVHQSKGLEFPVVFLADLDRKDQPPTDFAALDPDYGPLIRLKSSKRKASSDGGENHLGWTLFRHRENRETEAERLRLFYVACTRAADLLVLSAGMANPDKPRSRALRLLAQRFDLTTGLVRYDPDTGRTDIPERSLAEVPAVFVHESVPVAITARSEGPVDTTGEAGEDRTPKGPVHFRENVARTAPADWPELAVPIPVDREALNRYSVSDLEQIEPEQLGLTSWFAAHPNAAFEIIDHRPPSSVRGTKTGSERSEADAELLGTLVHAVLERLPTGEVTDLEAAIRDAWGNRARPLDEVLLAAAKEMLDGLLTSPLWGRIAAAQTIERETPFVVTLPDAETVWQVTGSIDLLVAEHGSGEGAPIDWSVYDYKTASLGAAGGSRGAAARQARARDLLVTYELQLGAYAVAMAEWLERAPRSVSLILVANGVTEIRVTPTPEFLDATRRRIAKAARLLQQR